MADMERKKEDEFAGINDEEISGRAGEEDDEDFEDADDVDEEEDEDEEEGI
jgi:hypothetical protein